MAQQPKVVETQLPLLGDPAVVDAPFQDTTNSDEIQAQTDADVTSKSSETALTEAEANNTGAVLDLINTSVENIKQDLDKLAPVEDTVPFTGSELVPAMWNIERQEELIVARCGSRVFKGTVQAFNAKFK